LHHGQFHPLVPLSATDLAVRTGRDGERSAERPASEAAAGAARHVAAGLDLFPGPDLLRPGLRDEMRRLLDLPGVPAWFRDTHDHSPAWKTSPVSADRLDLHLPALGRGHPRPVRFAAHQPASRRPVGDENHPPGDLPLLAPEGGLATILRPDPDGPPRGDAPRLQVLRVNPQRAPGGLVVVVVLADVDLLPLLARAPRVHDEAHTRPHSCAGDRPKSQPCKSRDILLPTTALA